MKIEWSAKALRAVHRFMTDQEGVHALVATLTRLPDDPSPAAAFPWGPYRRLRVGRYRVLYKVDEDHIEIVWIDRLPE